MWVLLSETRLTLSYECTTFDPVLFSGNTTTIRHEFPLPNPPASVDASGGFNYPNSNGFQFEAVAIHKCIRGGRTSSDQYTPDEMLAVSKVSTGREDQPIVGWARTVFDISNCSGG